MPHNVTPHHSTPLAHPTTPLTSFHLLASTLLMILRKISHISTLPTSPVQSIANSKGQKSIARRRSTGRNLKSIKTMHNKNKRKLAYNLIVRKALEIRARNCGPNHELNEDYSAYVKTQMWNPVFHHMDNG